MKKELLFITLIATSFLAGCVSDYMPAAPASSDPAATKLAEAATSVSGSLMTLEGIRKAEFPSYKKKLPDPNTYGMTQLASVDWTGPIGPLVEKLAKASDYRFRALGTPPAIPVIVAIHAENQSLAEILRDADYQAGEKADIQVYPKSRTIELRYERARSSISNISSGDKMTSASADFSNYVK